MSPTDASHEPSNDYAEISLADLFALFRRGLIPALIAAIIIGVGVYFASRQLDNVYESKTILVSSSPDGIQREFGATLVSATPLDTNAYRAAIVSTENVGAALTFGQLPQSITVKEAQQAISVRAEGSQSSALYHITIEHTDPAMAQALANAVAEAAVQWDVGRATKSLDTIIVSIEGQIVALIEELQFAGEDATAGLERKYAELTVQLSTARALKAGAIGRLEVLERAIFPTNPVAPQPTRNAAIAALLAVFLTYGVLLVREAVNTKFRSADSVQDALGSPILAEFPKISGPRRQIPIEAANYLRTAVDLVLPAGENARVVQIVSATPDQGKTAVAIALAESSARRGDKTLLIDADLRKPQIANEYHLHSGITLEQMLTKGQSGSPYRIEISEGVTLDIVPTFKPADSPSELLSGSFKQVLAGFREAYDMIIIDSAPVLPVSDPLITVPHTDGVLFTVSMPDAEQKAAQQAAVNLRRIGTPILGVVLTNVIYNRRRGYGYGYGYGYGDSSPR